MKIFSLTKTSLPVLSLLLVLPENLWALQPHGTPEGLYVHQMGHLLFMAALTYLYLHTSKTTTLVSKGWRYLRVFCLLLFLWNLVALIGHTMAGLLRPEDFLDTGTWYAVIASPLNFIKVVYFITTMDHLIFIPALFSLFYSLRTFYREAQKEEITQ